MQQGAKDFLSINILLSDILMNCQDEDLRSGFTKGYYISSIQSALEALAYDTFFQQEVIDVKMDQKKLQAEIPNNIFNIRELYLWNGDCCSPTNSVPVHYKRLFNNMNSGGAGYTAKIKDSGQTSTDAINPMFFNSFPTSVRWANIQNGILMFSSNCQGYGNIRMIANTTAGAIGDAPVIPRFFRDAIIDYVCERYFRIQMGKDRGAVAQWKVYDERLNGRMRNGADGSWARAENRIKTMDTWERDDLIEYMYKKW